MPDILRRIVFAAAALGVAGLGASVQAETLTVRGVYAPNADIPADIELIVFERFEGDMGQDVEFALTDALGQVQIEGQPWFDIISPEALSRAVVEIEAEDGTIVLEPLEADGIVRGTVRSERFERDLEPRVVEECVKRDDKRDCVEYKRVEYACHELTVRVDPRIVLIGSDGRQIYTHTFPQYETRSYCADESSVPSALELADGMVDEIVGTIRRDLAPGSYADAVRIMESRRGLNRDSRDAFRDAVRLTNNDPFGACERFRALEADNPQHRSVLFNIGLCWETASRLDLASDYYRRALAVEAGHDYPSDGLSRVRARQRGEAYIASRRTSDQAR